MTACVTLKFLVLASRESGSASLEGNATHYLGPAGKSVVICSLVLLLFGASVAMIVIVLNLLPLALEECLGVKVVQPLVVGLLAIGLIFPVTLQTSLHALRYTSTMALCCIAYFYSILVFQNFFCHHQPAAHHGEGRLDDVMQGWPVMIAAYICHFNIFKIDTELRACDKSRISLAINTAIGGIATSIYITGALMGYAMFGDAVSPNILTDFSPSPAIAGARLAIACTNLLKLPLLVLPLRSTIMDVLGHEGRSTSGGEGMLRNGTVRHVMLTALLVGAAFGLAYARQDLGKVLSLVGCTAGCICCYIIPSLIYIKYLQTSFAGHSASKWRRRREYFCAFVMLVWGTVVGFGGAWCTLEHFNSDKLTASLTTW